MGNLRPWGSAAYVHTSHKDGKLWPRGKKCIFIRYSEHSKGYVFIGENDDGSITEIESWDIDFLEEDFPNRGEVGKKIHCSNKNVEKIPQSLRDNGNNLPTSSSIPIGEDPQVELRRSKCESILHHRFKIKEKALMIAP